jgi:hypothetical protein
MALSPSLSRPRTDLKRTSLISSVASDQVFPLWDLKLSGIIYWFVNIFWQLLTVIQGLSQIAPFLCNSVCTVLALVQRYTAKLSSMLSAKRFQPWVIDLYQLLMNGDYIGCQTQTEGFVCYLLE